MNDEIHKALYASDLDEIGRGALLLSRVSLTNENVAARIQYARSIFHSSRQAGLADSIAVDHIQVNGTLAQFREVIFAETGTRRMVN